MYSSDLCVKHRISGFGQRVRPAEALGRQGTASWPVVPSLTPLSLFTISFRHGCLVASRCLSTLAARRSRRAGRDQSPKPRHAKVGAAMPPELGHARARSQAKICTPPGGEVIAKICVLRHIPFSPLSRRLAAAATFHIGNIVAAPLSNSGSFSSSSSSSCSSSSSSSPSYL